MRVKKYPKKEWDGEWGLELKKDTSLQTDRVH